jgi:purine-cytosine permease-like protein
MGYFKFIFLILIAAIVTIMSCYFGLKYISILRENDIVLNIFGLIVFCFTSFVVGVIVKLK